MMRYNLWENKGMIVYIEDTLIENSLITLLLLMMVNFSLKIKANKMRMFFSCLIAGMIALLYTLLHLNGFLLLLTKAMIGMIICFIAYSFKFNKKTMLNYTLFMLYTFIYGGINLFVYYSLYGNFASDKKFLLYLVILCVLFVSYFIVQVVKALYSRKNKYDFSFDISMRNGNKSISVRAYLDSGNSLVDPLSQKPVILVNYQIFSQLCKDISPIDIALKKIDKLNNGHYIKVQTANSQSELLSFCIDAIKIKTKTKTIEVDNPILALSKTKMTGFNCDVLLNIKLFERSQYV